jgi:hypothetical protein
MDPLFEFVPHSDCDFRHQNLQWISMLYCDWLLPDLTLCDSACDCTAFSDETIERPQPVISNEKGLQWAEKRRVREFCVSANPEDSNCFIDEYEELDHELFEKCDI